MQNEAIFGVFEAIWGLVLVVLAGKPLQIGVAEA